MSPEQQTAEGEFVTKSGKNWTLVRSGGGKEGWHPGTTKVDSRFVIDEGMGASFRLKINGAPPGRPRGEGHKHKRQEHAVYVISGRGDISLDFGEPQAMNPGDCIYIGAGVHHQVQVQGDEPFVCLMLDIPPEDEEENK